MQFSLRWTEDIIAVVGSLTLCNVLFIHLPNEPTGRLIHCDQSVEYMPEGLDEYFDYKMQMENRAGKVDIE